MNTKPKHEPTIWSESLQFMLDYLNQNRPPGEKKYTVYRLAIDADQNQPTIARIASGETREPGREIIAKVNQAFFQKLHEYKLPLPNAYKIANTEARPEIDGMMIINEDQASLYGDHIEKHSNPYLAYQNDTPLIFKLDMKSLAQTVSEVEADFKGRWMDLKNERKARLIKTYYEDIQSNHLGNTHASYDNDITIKPELDIEALTLTMIDLDSEFGDQWMNLKTERKARLIRAYYEDITDEHNKTEDRKRV